MRGNAASSLGLALVVESWVTSVASAHTNKIEERMSLPKLFRLLEPLVEVDSHTVVVKGGEVCLVLERRLVRQQVA